MYPKHNFFATVSEPGKTEPNYRSTAPPPFITGIPSVDEVLVGLCPSLLPSRKGKSDASLFGAILTGYILNDMEAILSQIRERTNEETAAFVKGLHITAVQHNLRTPAELQAYAEDLTKRLRSLPICPDEGNT